jgi:hypothetical protein
MQWNKTYGGTYYDDSRSLVQTSDGGFALTGVTFHSGNGSDYDMWIIKTNVSGQMQWTKTYPSTDTGECIIQSMDDGLVVVGQATSSDLNIEMLLVKTDVQSGLAVTDFTANNITLYRGLTDTNWNYVRIRIRKIA